MSPSEVAKCQPPAMLSGKDAPPQGQHSLICQKSTKHQPRSDQRLLQPGDVKAQAEWEHKDGCRLRMPTGKDYQEGKGRFCALQGNPSGMEEADEAEAGSGGST